MAAAPAHTLVGTVLSRRWRLVRKLGHGPLGEVYAAEGAVDGGLAAVKLLRAEFAREEAVRARFVLEGTACAAFVHSNVARTFECSAGDDGIPYRAMELLDGVPLAAYVSNGSRMAMPQAAHLVAGLLAGLEAAHARGIVHGDLKPDNVFLARQPDGTFAVKLLDFGMTRVAAAVGVDGGRARGGSRLRSAAYLSPEQVRATADVDLRADLFGAGVLLYEMLTGRVAFPAPTEYARIVAVLTAEPLSVEAVDPALAPASPLIARALKKDPAERFASAREMARALALLASAAAGSRASGGPSPGSVAASAPSPFSRLPAVPPLFAQAPVDLISVKPRASIAARSEVDAGADVESETVRSPVRSDGVVHASVPPVLCTPPAVDGTLPSQDPPVRGASTGSRRSRRIVTAVVVAAFAAGTMVGWAFAHVGR